MNERRFDGMGKVYARHRPGYATVFLDYLFSEAGFGAESNVADVGSGTGIFSKQMLDRGVARLYAVEPNSDMRIVAEKEMGNDKRYVSVSGTAESTDLVDDCVDFVTAAQAFHWFDKTRFKAECRRILKPQGKVVLVWNTRDESCELVRENERVIREYSKNFKGYSGGTHGAKGDNDITFFFEGNCETRVFSNDVAYDDRGFIGRNLSGSYAPKENDTAYGGYVTALKKLFLKYQVGGTVLMKQLTRSYMGNV